jgi:hypothetical protein
MRLVKFDEELQLVYAEVYSPGRPDSQGHFMGRATIRKMAHSFLAKMRTKQVNLEHGDENVDAVVVESFIASDNDPVFIPHSWVAGVHIADPALWEGVKSGEINGFSLEGVGIKETKVLEISVPEELLMTTEPGPNGHAHTATLHFDEDGNMAEGRTNTGQDGHWHLIRRGTITEPAMGLQGPLDDDHTHRFSFMEQLISNVA